MVSGEIIDVADRISELFYYMLTTCAHSLINLPFISGYSLSPSSSISTLTSSSSISIPQSLTGNSTAHHNTPPSRVIHCRAVADGCKETDLIGVLQPFGKIT